MIRSLTGLHRHLDGSLRPATLATFAARDGVDAPAEHERVLQLPGMSETRLNQAVEHGHAGRFAR